MIFFATCAKGTEGALRRELVAMRARSPRGDRGGVWFQGDREAAMAVCLRSRVAMRVLVQLAAFEATDADGLYAGARAVDWSEWLTPASTISVTASVRDSRTLTHSGYAALKTKDAVVDALRDKLGSRPDVAPSDPDVSIVLHVAATRAAVFLDLAGEPLHRRGYRVAMSEAPLKETLAAAVLALGGVSVEQPFVDPMGGSGTLAIEQALAARNMAPGLHRRHGFERWPTHGEAARAVWRRLCDEARAGILPAAPAPIVCRDRFPDTLRAARANAAAAGVERDITFEQGDVRGFDPLSTWPHGTVCTNPPYGERLGGRGTGTGGGVGTREGGPEDRVQQRKLAGLYQGMADAFLRLRGWQVVVLSGNPALARAMRLPPQVCHRLWNGPLEVRLLKWTLSHRG